jgi:anti-sigma factor ChrR (cupin superfamily)
LIAGLNFTGVTGVTATGGSVVLSVAKAEAFEAAGLLISVSSGDTVTVSDTATHIDAMTVNQIAGLASIGVTGVTASDASLTLSVAQASAFASAGVSVAAPAQETVTISDTAANIESGLAGLAAFSGAYSSITATGGKVTVSVAAFLADGAALNKIAGGFVVSDTAANIQAQLLALTADASHISSITETGAGVGGFGSTVNVSVATFAADQASLDKISAGFGISDTAANIFNGLAALEADQSNITTITSTDVPVAPGIGKFIPDEAVLNKVVGGFDIVGQASAIQVASNMDALENDIANINLITALNGRVTVSVATFERDQAALNEIAGGFAISDTAANLQNALPVLLADSSDIDSITAGSGVGGINPPVTVSVATFEADQSVLDKDLGGFAISDTAADIFNGLTALEADQSNITTITVTDVPVAPGVGKFVPDEAVLNKVVGGFDIVGQASAIQVAGNMDALENDVANINAITALNGTVTVSVATFERDHAALNEIVGGFAISDTAANIQNALPALLADSSDIDSITAGSGVGGINPPVTVSVATFEADQSVLDKDLGGFAISDTAADIFNGLTALEADQSNITTIASTDAPVTPGVGKFIPDETVLNKVAGGFDILGQSATIGANFDALEADVAHINSVAFADPSTPVLNLTQTQATNDASLLAEVTGPYVLNVSNGGATTTTGHGGGLTINAVAGGNDTITGGGLDESFVFGQNFRQDAIADFYQHATGAGADMISLPSADFASFAAMTADTSFSGGNAIIAATNGDTLTLQHVTSATLQNSQADFKFT